MPVLYLIATPIGNIEDISYRVVRILSSIEILACEDTRWTRKIFEKYSIKSPSHWLSYHEHNEEPAIRKIISFLKQGKDVGVCSCAGYPGISDPGYRLVTQAIEEGIVIEVLPGPSAVLTALVLSGMPTSSFIFKGFAPKKKGQRCNFLEADKESPHTLIFFESPIRVKDMLSDALEVLGNRKGAVCIELTKMYQRVFRGSLKSLITQISQTPQKGEVTVVIGGNKEKMMVIEDVDNTDYMVAD